MRLWLLPSLICAVMPAYGAVPQFSRPWGIVTTSAGKQFVRDAEVDHLIALKSDGAPSLAVVKPDGLKGSFDITLDGKGRIYTAKWPTERNPLSGFVAQDASGKVVASHLAPEGKKPGQVSMPAGIGVDSKGHVYIADTGNDRIQEFAPDGRLLAVIGAGDLRLPMKVAFDRNGAMYVADSGKNRIAVFERDVDGKWLLMRSLGSGIKEPVSVLVDGRGRVFVSTNRKAGVYMFDEKGDLQWSYLGAGATRMSSPRGLAFDVKGGLCVVDESTRRIWRLTPPE